MTPSAPLVRCPICGAPVRFLRQELQSPRDLWIFDRATCDHAEETAAAVRALNDPYMKVGTPPKV